MVLNVTFNNMSVMSWRSVLLLEGIEEPRENHDVLVSKQSHMHADN